MIKGLAGVVLVVMIVGMSGLMMLGWAYEGPRRLAVRLKRGFTETL